eukprot:14874756-Alexandrium_andersonii.AAC.1
MSDSRRRPLRPRNASVRQEPSPGPSRRCGRLKSIARRAGAGCIASSSALHGRRGHGGARLQVRR